MSQNSAIKIVRKTARALGVSAWVLLGLFGFSAATIFAIFQILPESARHYLLETTPGLLVLTAAQYVITLAVVVGVPLLIRRRSKGEATDLKKLLGIADSLRLKFALVVPLVWVAYFLTSNVAVLLATSISGFDANQTQDVGFNNLTNLNEMVLAFIALIILAPLAEELLFRGYLFGKLREMGGFWPSAILTSAVFGAAHLQWNVGIDVFVLSLFLCVLRERSGSIWAGVLLHGFKNSIAYFILFIAPLIGLHLQ
jgi:membrane protease YdiL (CAAX protease family)